jgi:beta-lactamase class A
VGRRPLAFVSALVVLATTTACGSSRTATPASTTTTTSTTAAPVTTAATAVATTTSATPSTTAGHSPTTAPTSTLQGTIDGFAAQHSVPFSVVAIDLTTGKGASHLANRQVLSASLYKLFVARELLRRIYAGTLQRSAPAGDSQQRTVGECLRAMIVVSDNACGVAGLGMVGGGALDAALARDGYTSTRMASPQRTSAADVARFLQKARNHTLLDAGGEDASTELYGLLQAQQVNDRLPTGLPPGTPIAHKTGDRIGWAHDAGVITTTRGDVLLAVLSGPWAPPCCDADHPGPAEKVAFGAIADLGSRVYRLYAG